jgi:hypothetical protein
MTVPFLGQNFNVITDTGMLREFLGLKAAVSEPAGEAIEPTNQVSTALAPARSSSQGAFAGWPLLLSGACGIVLGGGLVGWRLGRPT